MIYLDSLGDECNCEECLEAEADRIRQFDRIIGEELEDGRQVAVAKEATCPSKS